MRTFKTLALTLTCCIGLLATAQDKKETKLMEDATKAKSKVLEAAPELTAMFDSAFGYAVFPNVGKGGLIIGGASGNGIVYENGNPIGRASLKKIDIGLQAGGKAVIEIIFFENEAALNEFKGDDFAFDAGASAVVLKSGKSVKAKYKDGVAVYALPKAGLMVDASVGGQHFDYKAFKSSY